MWLHLAAGWLSLSREQKVNTILAGNGLLISISVTSTNSDENIGFSPTQTFAHTQKFFLTFSSYHY